MKQATNYVSLEFRMEQRRFWLNKLRRGTFVPLRRDQRTLNHKREASAK